MSSLILNPDGNKRRWVSCSQAVNLTASLNRHLIIPGARTTLCGDTASTPEVWRGNTNKPECPRCLRRLAKMTHPDETPAEEKQVEPVAPPAPVGAAATEERTAPVVLTPEVLAPTEDDPREGVWAYTVLDYTESIERVFTTELEALRHVNAVGSGHAVFLPFGKSLSELVAEK